MATKDSPDQGKRPKFGESDKSVDANLSKLPKEVQDRYHRNRARYAADAAALEKWAASGFDEGGGVDEYDAYE